MLCLGGSRLEGGGGQIGSGAQGGGAGGGGHAGGFCSGLEDGSGIRLRR